MSRELFDRRSGLVRPPARRPGPGFHRGLCAGFAAINGSSVATAATMSQVALPEMRRAGYDPGCRPAHRRRWHAGHHDPAVGDLRAVRHHDRDRHHQAVLRGRGARSAGGGWIFDRGPPHRALRYPAMLPVGEQHTWANASAASKTCGPCWLLFMFVLGGIYGGLFTVQEAAGIGRHRYLAHRGAARPASQQDHSPRADRCAARVLGHHADRGGRLPVRLLPHYHAVHPEGGRFSGAPARRGPTACWRS
jgi:C4-dicarboxylate transporter DctM subunit